MNSDDHLRTCYVGSISRGKQFIHQIFGYFPQQRSVGACLATCSNKRLEEFYKSSDVIMIEINRLFLAKFIENGFFPIPEWVEFERPVIKDELLRYAGATKSLKSDLNRIKKNEYRISVSKNIYDFEMFYETMYIPSVKNRYGNNAILKSRRRLKRDLLSGFLVFVFDGQLPVAGAIVLPEKDIVRETTIGIANGSEKALKSGVTGILDYYIHQWAADHGKKIMNVGHTRAFPSDGVFFNKRKWMMRVIPDQDGVTNIAVKFNVPVHKAASLIHTFPFIFQTQDGLHLLCSLNQTVPATPIQLKSIHQRYWTEGLRSMSILSPAGFSPQAVEYRRGFLGPSCHLISEIKSPCGLCKERIASESLAY